MPLPTALAPTHAGDKTAAATFDAADKLEEVMVEAAAMAPKTF